MPIGLIRADPRLSLDVIVEVLEYMAGDRLKGSTGESGAVAAASPASASVGAVFLDLRSQRFLDGLDALPRLDGEELTRASLPTVILDFTRRSYETIAASARISRVET